MLKRGKPYMWTDVAQGIWVQELVFMTLEEQKSESYILCRNAVNVNIKKGV
jgi:hypothetical protein